MVDQMQSLLKTPGVNVVSIIILIFSVGIWVERSNTSATELSRIERTGTVQAQQNTVEIRVLKEQVNWLMLMVQENKADHTELKKILTSIAIQVGIKEDRDKK